MKVKSSYISSPLAFVCNMAMMYAVYGICRLAYLFENWSVLSAGFDSLSFWDAFKGCWLFDTSAILYTNALYAVLMLLPLHFKETNLWQSVAKWIYIVMNAICIIANLSDAVYFQYTGRRTTTSVFSEFSHESNLAGVFGVELLYHWYLVLLGVLLIVGIFFLYVKPHGRLHLSGWKSYVRYYAVQLICFALYIPITICGMRGGATTATRPITISNANQYINRPAEAALILNTPFSLIRTINKAVFADPNYFTREELNTIYTPIHTPSDTLVQRQKNVVVLILESFGREYIGAYNTQLDGGHYQGYTPFVDSLISILRVLLASAWPELLPVWSMSGPPRGLQRSASLPAVRVPQEYCRCSQSALILLPGRYLRLRLYHIRSPLRRERCRADLLRLNCLCSDRIHPHFRE